MMTTVHTTQHQDKAYYLVLQSQNGVYCIIFIVVKGSHIPSGIGNCSIRVSSETSPLISRLVSKEVDHPDAYHHEEGKN